MGEQPVYGTRESIDWEATAELWKERARDSEAKRAELEAVIEKVREAWFGHAAFDPTSEDGSAVTAALNAAPSVVLGEHDRKVRAAELEAAAVIAEGQILHGRYSPARVEKCQDIAKLLRERAAAIRNGEHA